MQYGPNELRRRGGARWPRELARQFTHPLALLLWAAALLAWLAGIVAVAIAIVVVIVINAVFAFIQEAQAERAVEALARVPAGAGEGGARRRRAHDRRTRAGAGRRARDRGGRPHLGRRAPARAGRSRSTCRCSPASRCRCCARPSCSTRACPCSPARELVLSGTACTEGDARALVFATGMHTELGRIAALSERVTAEESPLEQQVRRVAWLIALIAVGLGIAFMPLAMLGAGLPFKDAVVFAVGLLVGNVPEGLLPVITLALAVGVRGLVRQGAVVKRLSAVETLGSTDVICTDKTGTLTENRMRVTAVWSPSEELDLDGRRSSLAPRLRRAGDGDGGVQQRPARRRRRGVRRSDRGGAAGRGRAAWSDARPGAPRAASAARVPLRPDAQADVHARRARRRRSGSTPRAHPRRCCPAARARSRPTASSEPLADGARELVRASGGRLRARRPARAGARPPPAARRRPSCPSGASRPSTTSACWASSAMIDPPRAEVAEAVADCHAAGIRIIVITGDHGLTAAAIARQVGIGGEQPRDRHGRPSSTP